jgi:FixJ family two-component response regulator
VLKHQEFLGSSKTEADLKSRYTQLSPREQQIMAMATAGLMNKQIAGELGLSEITVKIHRGKVSRKMSAKTFADLVKMAELLGLSHR